MNYATIPYETLTGDQATLTIEFAPEPQYVPWATHKSPTMRATYLLLVCARMHQAVRPQHGST